jgi:hypothetical protein
MGRASCLTSIVAVVAWVVPGCSGPEFTAADESDAGEAGEMSTGGKGGSSGQGGSSSGTAGTDGGGSDVGGNGNGGSSRGGNGGTVTGGAQTGGNAGDGASGGSDAGGMGGTSGASTGGAGAGSGGGSGRAGGGAGGVGGAGAGGKGGVGGAGAGGKGGVGGAGSGGKGIGGAGAGGKGGVGGAGPSMCPANAPSAGSACSFMGHCSYGTHPLQRCRDVYACDGVRWQLTQDANCATPASCQDLPTPPVINAQCMPDGAECQGANNLFCLCAPNCSTVCSYPPIWHCFGAPGDCPAVLPNRGQPCNVNLSCVYGSCASQTGVQAICENGAWVWYGLICPQ